MNRPLAVALLVLAPLPLGAQHQAADTADRVVEGVDFQVYDARGRSRSFAEVVVAMGGADAVLVGETHDDVVGHGVELELLIRAAQRHGGFGAVPGEGGRPVVLSLEMFERDVQSVLDEYLGGYITEDQFLRASRPWDRYGSDYRPMVEFARSHDLEVVAANAPRRYVNRVTRLGPESLAELPDEARGHLPPLPYPGPSARYTEQWNALMADMMRSSGAGGGSSHDTGRALQSQALWDAAMGHAVAEALARLPGALVVHYAGSFHVEAGTGIPERVPDYRPGARVITVVLKPAEDIRAWNDDEHAGLGDFVILTLRPALADTDDPGLSSR